MPVPVLRLLAAAHAALLLAGGAAVVLHPAAPRAAAPVLAVAADAGDVPARTPLRRAAAPAPAAEPAAVVVTAPRGAPAPRATGPRAATAAPARRLTVQERGEAALAALGYPWQRLGYAVEFRPHTGRTAGLADPRTRTITVYVKQRQDELELRATIAHELGHALDFDFGSAERRQRYRELRGLPAETAWYPCSHCEDYASPAGDWAEVFAAVLVGPGDFRSRLAGPPPSEQLAELRALFAVPERPAAAPEPPPAPPQEEPAEEDDEDEDGLLPL